MQQVIIIMISDLGFYGSRETEQTNMHSAVRLPASLPGGATSYQQWLVKAGKRALLATIEFEDE